MYRRKHVSIAILIAAAFAAASPTLDGDIGTPRTYSAKTLGNGVLSIGVTGNGSNDANILQDGSVVRYDISYDTVAGRAVNVPRDTTKIQEIFDLTATPYMSFGISNYFDLTVALPIYVDYLTGWALSSNSDLNNASGGGIGDLKISGKLQYPPYAHDSLWEMAFMGIMTIPTGTMNKGFIPKELWYIPKDSTVTPQFYTAQEPTLALLMLNTVDFSQLDHEVHLQWHLNFGIQTTQNSTLDNSFLLSSSVVWQPSSPLFSLFLEFSGQTRMSKFTNGFNMTDDPMYLTPGFVITAENGVAVTLSMDWGLTQGSQLATMRIDPNPGPRAGDILCPNCTGDGEFSKYKVHPTVPLSLNASISWTGSLQAPDRDHDGVPDDEDLCPDIPQGPDGKDGCPNPDVDKDGFCDPWVANADMLDKFASICHGIDKCPEEPLLPGMSGKDGCPNPDSDSDGVCDLWVTEKGQLGKYASICHGKDLCPNVSQGPNGKDGCPNPDSDSDGVCDPWVAANGLSAQYAAVCKGSDECPNLSGPGTVNGCPNPDSDGDSICDPWVSAKGLSAKYAKICHGTDLCPTVPQGVGGTGGCPNPDTDKDSICDPWVSEKGLSAQFASVCHGKDLCPTIPQGLNGKDGCPDMTPKVIEKHDTVVQVRKDTVVNTVVKQDTVIKRDTVVIQIEKKATVVMHGVNFGSNSADLTPESFAKLDEVANDLKRSPGVVIEIRGHTDDRGSEKKNRQLSQDRADAVCRYLVSQGVPAAQLKATGFGSKMPITSNKTAAGREKNRRIEMYRVQ